jgi:hypothetical protein
MRPLFWDRILLEEDEIEAADMARGEPTATPSESTDDIERSLSVWALLDEANLNVEDFEAHFSQKAAKTKVKEEKPVEPVSSKQAFTALDGKRSQGVGIIMGSNRLSESVQLVKREFFSQFVAATDRVLWQVRVKLQKHCMPWMKPNASWKRYTASTSSMGREYGVHAFRCRSRPFITTAQQLRNSS